MVSALLSQAFMKIEEIFINSNYVSINTNVNSYLAQLIRLAALIY